MAGGGGSANTRTENIRTCQICGLKTGKKKRNKSSGRLSDYGPKLATRLIVRRELFKLWST